MTATAASPTTAKDSFLRMAIRLDAVLSGIMGVAGLATAAKIAEMSGTTTAFEYSMSALFIAYGAVVYVLSLKERVRTLGAVLIVGNIVFSVLAVAMVLAGPFPLTSTGIALTLGSGVYTLVMADLQYLGLRRLRR